MKGAVKNASIVSVNLLAHAVYNSISAEKHQIESSRALAASETESSQTWRM